MFKKKFSYVEQINKAPGLWYILKLLKPETPYLELSLPAEYLNIISIFNH
jgi:hypothetical protein